MLFALGGVYRQQMSNMFVGGKMSNLVLILRISILLY